MINHKIIIIIIIIIIIHGIKISKIIILTTL
jgi:hypothetical protein